MVERGGLENRCGCKPTQGSNPCLSASNTPRQTDIAGLVFSPTDRQPLMQRVCNGIGGPALGRIPRTHPIFSYVFGPSLCCPHGAGIGQVCAHPGLSGFLRKWVPIHLLRLLGSIVVNYLIARRLGIASGAVNRKILLVIGVASNLGAIAYFKYRASPFASGHTRC